MGGDRQGGRSRWRYGTVAPKHTYKSGIRWIGVLFVYLKRQSTGPSFSVAIAPLHPMVVFRISVLVLLLVGGSSAAWGQDQRSTPSEAVPDSVIKRITAGLSNGDTQQLLTPAADRVEISLFGTRTFYSSAQALYVLRDFFDTHTPSDFTIVDATGSGQSCFVRGQLRHARSERPFQVYLRLVRREATWELHEIRVD